MSYLRHYNATENVFALANTEKLNKGAYVYEIHAF